ncbi:nucleotidyltransferase family protein [Streptomyces europaeiscabiei]|uniref:nucleotidyltransferase family protein n=1 Tax=Streptomyces europaeiscabiei TaxID=146819 RepID=UPI002E18307F
MALFDYRFFCTPSSPWDSLTATDLPALADAPSIEQEMAFVALVLRNPDVRAVLERLASLGLPPWYLTAGALFQTVWNVAAGHADLSHGIRDFDLFYYDAEDLSYEAEDVVIRRCLRSVGGLGVELEPRNQARVHLWYEKKFGRPIEPYRTLEEPISSFAFTCCSVALSLNPDGMLTTYATHGYADLFRGVLRPSPSSIAPDRVSCTKATAYRSRWPHLVEPLVLGV